MSTDSKKRRRKSDRNGGRVLQWLPLALAVLIGATAWGTQSQQVKDLDRRVEVQEASQARLQQIEVKQGVIEERTRSIKEQLRQQGVMIQRVLDKLDRGPSAR